MTFRKVIRALFTQFSANALGRLLSALTVLLIARELGPDVYGIYAGALATAQLFSALFSLGLEGWMLRNGGQNRYEIGELFAAALSIQLGLGLLWFVGYVVIATSLLRSNILPSVIVLAALCIWFDELNTLVRAAFKARFNNAINVLVIALDSSVFLIWTVVSMLQGQYSPVSFLIGRLTAACLSFAVGVAIFNVKYRIYWSVIPLRTVVSQALPYALSIGLATVYGKIDVAVVSQALGNQSAGIYSSAISLVRTLFLIPATVFSVLLPAFSQVLDNKPHQIQAWIRNALIVVTLMGLTLSVAMYVLAVPVSTGILGEAYQETGPVLRILSWMLTFRCVNFGLAAVIVAVGKQRERLYPQLISAVIAVISTLIAQRYESLALIAGIHVASEALLALGYGFLVVTWLRKQPKAYQAT